MMPSDRNKKKGIVPETKDDITDHGVEELRNWREEFEQFPRNLQTHLRAGALAHIRKCGNGTLCIDKPDYKRVCNNLLGDATFNKKGLEVLEKSGFLKTQGNKHYLTKKGILWFYRTRMLMKYGFI